MAKRLYFPEQIINKLREAEILLNQVATISEASKKIGIIEQSRYETRLQDTPRSPFTPLIF